MRNWLLQGYCYERDFCSVVFTLVTFPIQYIHERAAEKKINLLYKKFQGIEGK